MKSISFLALASITLATSAVAAPQKKIAMPDFTKGDAIPEGANHDWNLGATGARGWMFSEKLVTSNARQIAITKVDPGSPADGVLKSSDVILGIGREAFAGDARTAMGKALTKAEIAGALPLLRWRDGKTETVTIQLPKLGTYSDTAPFRCAKSKRILELGCDALAKEIAKPQMRQNPITRSLNALALLASGDAKYHPLLKGEAEWAAGYSANSFQTWWYGYTISFLAEYVLATGDESVLPGLRRLAVESAEGQSVVGSWGHKFAGEDGRLLGYGMMNAPGIPLTIALELARRAGVTDPSVDRAIERSTRLLRFYVNKGAIPYGDHAPWIQTHDDNGKNGMAAVLFHLLGDKEAAEYFSRMAVASHGAERDCGHTGNFTNMLWSMPAVALSGPEASGAWMKEFGGWYFDLARRPDGSFLHQGPPAVRKDKFAGWDTTGAYLLAYAMPLKKLYLTGKGDSTVPQIDRATAASLIRDGRGWDNLDRNSAYDSLSADQLLDRLESWSPVVRERAAMALERGKNDITDKLIALLGSSKISARYGACQAIKQIRGRAAKTVPALRKTLNHDDLGLRILAAEALAAIGKPAMPAVPDLLERLAKPDRKADPRATEQRYLSMALFNRRGLLGRSLEGVDRDQLLAAVRAGLQNEDGRARGSFVSVYQNLSYDEIKPLLPAVHRAIVEPAPSGIMFASGIRLGGVELLAKHHIAEGIPLCLEVMEIDKWGKQDRIKRAINALATYGAAAKPMLPRLRQLEKDLRAHREARNLAPIIERVVEVTAMIESSKEAIKTKTLSENS